MKTNPLSILNSLLYISGCLQFAAKKRLAACSLKLEAIKKLAACNLKLAAKKLAACSLWLAAKKMQLAAILLLTAAACSKEEPKHRDIVTATMNGNPWKAGCKESPPFGCSIADLQYYSDTGGFSLRASDTSGYGNIRIRLSEVFNLGEYKMRDKTQCAIINKGEPCGIRRHYIDENDPQEIEIISIDQEKKIIEGKFHFIGRDTNCLSEPVHYTNGYFKVRYRP